MSLLNNCIELNKYSVLLSDEKQIIDTLSYQEMMDISETLTILFKIINNENICLGLLMDHNLYIPSIILSLQKLKYTFVFLTSKNFDKTVNFLKYQWILSFDDTKDIYLFQEVNRLKIRNKVVILWNQRERLPSKLNFQNIFCVVQTSGSTGENKLIRVTNACIETNASNLRKEFDIKSDDIIFWGTNLTFDPSLIELILALQSGASLLIVPHRVFVNPNILFDALFNVVNITFLQMVPSVFVRWNEHQIKQILLNSKMRVLALGGEHFPKKILSYERKNALRLFNLYGISEVSCWATLHEIRSESYNDNIPIGKTLEATLLEVRDEFGNVSNNGKGEIFIGSSSRICYINEELQNETSGIVFRETGDIAEIKEDKIFLVGRKNKIIKRFGHRINLTKIENKIFEETGLENVCVWSQKKTKLLTFILMKNLNLQIKEKILDKLRIKLINILPDENFPDFIDIVTHFPLTSHGKINEKALESLSSTSEIKRSYEDTFSQLWCKCAGISAENLAELQHYKFFEIGGNSISAIQLLTEIKETTARECPHELVTMIFENSFEDCMNYLKGFEPVKKKFNEGASDDCIAKKRKLMKDNLRILWSYDLKACVDGSPLVFEKENEVYSVVGSFSHHFVVLRQDGQVVYKITLPDAIESTPSISPCQNFILVGCFNGRMYCVDFVKKQIVWEFITDGKIKCSACFCSKKSTAFFGSYDKVIYCVSVLEGVKIWSNLLDGSISANPIYGENKKNVYAVTIKGTCFSLNEENGEVKWKKNCGGPIFGTPCLVNSEKNIIIPVVQGILHCLQTENGELLWRYQADGHIFSSLVSYKNQLLFGCFDKSVNIVNISESDCVLVKKIMVTSEISATPFVYNEHGNFVIVTACNVGVISVIDFSTLELISSIQLPAEVFSSPVVHNDKIFVGCRDNNFYCIELNK